MKRTLTVLLILAMILTAPAAMASSVQEALAPYDDAMLQMVAEMYASELLRRTGGSITLEPGIYQIGLDIPPLAYRIELADDTITATITCFADDEAFAYSEFFFLTTLIQDNTPAIGRVFLNEGNGLVIEHGSVRLIPFTGVMPE